MQLDPGKRKTTTTTTRARTIAAAFSPGWNGEKPGMTCDAWTPDVFIAGLKAGSGLVYSGTVPDRYLIEKIKKL
jgi:hypothetical protein